MVTSPAGLARTSAVAAWWTKDRRTAHDVVRATGEQRPGSVEAATTEVLAAAQRLDVALSVHDVVLARAQAAVDKLNGKLAAAQQAGALQTFNRAYKAYRLDCVARGERAMPYGTALAKLRGLLAGAAAGAPTANMLQAVFKPSELDP